MFLNVSGCLCSCAKSAFCGCVGTDPPGLAGEICGNIGKPNCESVEVMAYLQKFSYIKVLDGFGLSMFR